MRIISAPRGKTCWHLSTFLLPPPLLLTVHVGAQQWGEGWGAIANFWGTPPPTPAASPVGADADAHTYKHTHNHCVNPFPMSERVIAMNESCLEFFWTHEAEKSCCQTSWLVTKALEPLLICSEHLSMRGRHNSNCELRTWRLKMIQ